MGKSIYLVLTNTGSLLSNTIKLYTRAEFNHVSLSLFPDLEPMWSFGRKLPYFAFWGGFVKEEINRGTFLRFPRTTCQVNELPVTDEQYEAIKKIIEEMYSVSNQYGYDLFGLLCASMKICYRRRNKFYCSEFVRNVLLKAGVLGIDKMPSIVEPSDFLRLTGIKPVYRGKLSEFPKEMVERAQLVNTSVK